MVDEKSELVLFIMDKEEIRQPAAAPRR